MRNTVLAIERELTEQGLVLRYRPDQTDDGLAGAHEGAFLICSFWLVSGLLEIAEEIEPLSGRHLGNFPQAFTHLALINAVLHVIRDEESAPLGT